MRKFLICIALALLPAAALAQSVGEKTGINSTLGITPSTADFVKEAAMSDLFEIEAGKVAQQKGENTKALGSKLVQDHTATSDELKSLVTGGKVPVEIPTTLDSSHKSMLDKLQSLNGADFDKQFVSDNISGHKSAISLFERYAKGGDNPELKAFAEKTLPKLQEHLQMAESLNK
jgi:putative membrane protein